MGNLKATGTHMQVVCVEGLQSMSQAVLITNWMDPLKATQPHCVRQLQLRKEQQRLRKGYHRCFPLGARQWRLLEHPHLHMPCLSAVSNEYIYDKQQELIIKNEDAS